MAGKATSSALRQSWQRRTALGWVLWPVSLLYGALTGLRRWGYRLGVFKSTRIPVPVITVGNVIAGGAGKTPVTIAIVEHLKSQGYRPGVVSRGYGRQTRDCRAVATTSTASEVGDEPLLIAAAVQVPVFVANQRVEAAQALLAAHPEVNVIVCDDALQHLALQRDIEVCVFNSDGVGNGWLLPAGPLREPWPRAVDLVLFAGAPPRSPAGPHPAQFELKRTLAHQLRDATGRTIELTSLRGTPVHAVAAVARPEEFFGMLRDRGLTVAAQDALPDHYDFADWTRRPTESAPLLCTEKDATKLWPRQPDALAAKLEVDIPAAFFQQLDALLKRYHLPLAR